MLQAQRHNMSIMHQVSSDSGLLHYLLENRGVHGSFGEQHQGRRIQQISHAFERGSGSQGRMVDPRVSDYAQKFINTGPGNSPSDWTLSQLAQKLARA